MTTIFAPNEEELERAEVEPTLYDLDEDRSEPGYGDLFDDPEDLDDE